MARQRGCPPGCPADAPGCPAGQPGLPTGQPDFRPRAARIPGRAARRAARIPGRAVRRTAALTRGQPGGQPRCREGSPAGRRAAPPRRHGRQEDGRGHQAGRHVAGGRAGRVRGPHQGRKGQGAPTNSDGARARRVPTPCSAPVGRRSMRAPQGAREQRILLALERQQELCPGARSPCCPHNMVTRLGQGFDRQRHQAHPARRRLLRPSLARLANR